MNYCVVTTGYHNVFIFKPQVNISMVKHQHLFLIDCLVGLAVLSATAEQVWLVLGSIPGSGKMLLGFFPSGISQYQSQSLDLWPVGGNRSISWDLKT